jgi:hypothetical protein
MKHLLLLFVFAAGLLSISSCKKEPIKSSGSTATIQVINGAIDVPIMLQMNGRLNTSGLSFFSSSTSQVDVNSAAFFYTEGEPTTVDLLNGIDTSLLFSANYDFKKQGIYTLLVAGQLPNIESVLIDDTNYPYIEQDKIPGAEDSIINIRFVNLSPEAPSVDIRMTGSSTNEVSGLAYKGYTDFKTYPAKPTDYFGTFGYSILSFEVVEDGNVLASYDVFVYEPGNRYKNVALTLTGLKSNFSLSLVEMSYFQL